MNTSQLAFILEPQLGSMLSFGAVASTREGEDSPTRGFQQPRYPDRPGFKELETSKEAAEAIEPESSQLRTLCLALIREKPSTSDEIARIARRSILVIRPRISELRKMGKIVATGQRRVNSSGMSAAVWRAA